MLTLLLFLLVSYAVGILLPFSLTRKPQAQRILVSICASVAGGIGIALGISGLVASEPLTASIDSAIPFLTFAVRLDPLASFFVLTISLASLAANDRMNHITLRDGIFRFS